MKASNLPSFAIARTTGSLQREPVAAERSFGPVQTVRIFALLPKSLTKHAKNECN